MVEITIDGTPLTFTARLAALEKGLGVVAEGNIQDRIAKIENLMGVA